MLLCVTAAVFTWPKLSHTQKKRQRAHEKRRKTRQELARLRDEGADSEEEGDTDITAADLKRAEVAWLNREAVAQTLFTESQSREEERRREKEALKQRIKDEFLKLKEGGPDIKLIKAADQEDREALYATYHLSAVLWLITQMKC